MLRLAGLVVALLALPSAAGPNHRAEAVTLVGQLLTGQARLNQFTNRILFLGETRYASAELCRALRREPNPRVRQVAVEALAALGVANADTERAFIDALGDDDTATRLAGMRGLGRVRSAEGVPLLVEALKEGTLAVRREAARALGDVGRSKAGPALLAAAKAEDDLETRAVMLVAAGRTQDKKLARPLEGLLESDSEVTRLAAAQALCALGAKSGAAYAARLLASEHPAERMQGVRLFEGAGLAVAGPPLKRLRADGDDRVRAAAARVLAQAGDASSAQWLVLESERFEGDQRLLYEDEIEKLRLSDEARRALVKKAARP